MLGDLFHGGVTPLLAAAFILVMMLYYVYGRGKKYSLPPGPTPLPIIGNILMFMRSKKETYELMADYAKIYGPICSFRFGVIQMVVLNNIELVKEALVKIPDDFAGRPKTFTGDALTQGGKDIALADFGPTWRLHRKIAFNAMRTYIRGPLLEAKVHISITKAFKVMEKEVGPYDPKDHLSLIVYNFICGFCYGQSYDIEDPEFQKLMEISDTFLVEAANGLPEDFVPFLKHFPLKGSKRLLNLFKELLDLLEKKFFDHQGTYDASHMRDFIDCLIHAKQEALEEEKEALISQLTDTHLVQTLADIFGAGTDTSRFTMYWSVLFMANYPEIQEKVHEEIIKAVGKDRLPSLSDKRNLSYTEATLQECMRLRPVVPLGVPHRAMVDSKIANFDVPKGTIVTVNHWALHQDPDYWKTPEIFQPERFLKKDGSPAPKPESFLPFSAGRRVCLGESVAKPELLMIFAAILQRFKISVPNGVTLDPRPTGGAAGSIPKPYKILSERRF